MHYKTIVLELLEQQQPVLYDELRSSKRLLSTMNELAILLRELHQQQLAALQQLHPAEDTVQMSSEAMELAVNELQHALLPANSESCSLDEAMLYIRSRMPRE